MKAHGAAKPPMWPLAPSHFNGYHPSPSTPGLYPHLIRKAMVHPTRTRRQCAPAADQVGSLFTPNRLSRFEPDKPPAGMPSRPCPYGGLNAGWLSTLPPSQ